MLPNTQAHEARALAESLRQLVAETRFNDEIALTCSFGVAELQTGQSIESWLQSADIALYKAKSDGRNRVVIKPASTS